MNLDGSPGRPGNRQHVTRRRSTRTSSPTSPVVSPDRDVDLRRRFEALKGDLTAAKLNANSPGCESVGQKVPLTLADIQGSIAKKHTTDLANAQRKWIESLNLQTPVDTGPSEEDAQKEWINHISISKISDRPSRRDDGQRQRSIRSLSSEYHANVPSPRSSGATSPQKVPRNITVRSTFLTPVAPSFGYCDVPHLTINSLPVTATSVKEVVKPDKEFVTESGKTIKMLKLEEPPKPEKVKGRSPQKMKAVIDLNPSKNEGGPKAHKEKRHFRASLSPKKHRASEGETHVARRLSPDAVEKYKLSVSRTNSHAKDGSGKTRSKSEHKSFKKLKRSSSLPGGLFKEKVDQEAATKHARTYDVKETRCFIKQKQKEREERMAEERRKTVIEAEERKMKMQQLRETQRNIMQKIKKRTVNRRHSLDKPKWVGPVESTAPSVLESSFEFTVPKPKTPVLSNDATGTMTFKRPRDPKPLGPACAENRTPVDVVRENEHVRQHAVASAAICTQTDQEPQLETSSSTTVFKNFCLKDLEVSTDLPLQLKRPAPQLVETAVQIDLISEKKSPIKTKSVAISTHNHSKRPKQNLSQERLVNKENLGSNVSNSNSQYSSRFDKFLADYVPTPKKGEGTGARPKTPPWLQEMSQYPDQFNLINTLNKAYWRKQKLESSKISGSKENSSASSLLPGSSKIHEIGCTKISGVSQDFTPAHSEQMSNTSSRISELFLEAPAVKLTDGRSSSNLSTSAHSFEAFAPSATSDNDMKLSAPQTPRLTLGDLRTSGLNFLFPSKIGESRENTFVETRKKCSIGEFLGEKVPLPKGQITERKPLKHRTKVLDENRTASLKPLETSLDPFSDFHTKRGSDVDLHHVAPSSPDIGHSRSTSFSSMKEGSYVLTHSETKSDNSVKTIDIIPEPGFPRLSRLVPQSALSEHSSDSVSEIVKVSRTVSRGSTVISEEVSEVQNTVSVSKIKFNSSSIQNKIRSEIEQLDRVNDSLTSFMESSKMVLTGDMHSALNQSEPTLEPTSQDLVTVRHKSSLRTDDEVDISRLAVTRSVSHSRDPSNSSLDMSLPSVSGADITKFTVEVYDNLIKDEKLRSDKLVSGLKVSMKGLWSRAKKELESIETQRKKLIETGHEEEARELKRKQRGYIIKLNEEFEEMQKQKALEHKACQERCMLLKQQQQIIKLLLQNRRESSAKDLRGSLKSLQSTQIDDTVKYMGNERNTGLIDRKRREYREKEEALRERKKNVEAIVAWKKRLELEEKSVREMEKLIAQSTFSAPLPEITSSAVERGTSPFTVAKDEEEKVPESRIPIGTTSQSESDHQNKDYYSDSFEHSSALSDAAGSALAGSGQGSSLLNKAMKMPMLKVPLSPRVTIIKRRHSSGSDESMLLSQNDTLSEPSDVEVRVSALEQQLRHRKSELAKLKREYQKNQKERLRYTEKNLISQIQIYDSYIEQVKNEIKDLENTDVKVTKPQIKQPKFSDRRQSDKFVSTFKSKESHDGASDAKNTETAASEDMSSQDGSVLFLGKPQEQKLPEFQKADSPCETEKMEVGTDSNVQEQIVSELVDFEALSNVEISGFTTDPALKTAMEKVKMKAMESKDSESSTSEKDFSIEEIFERAEQSKMDSSDEIHTQSNILTEASLSDIATDDNKSKLSVVEELTEIATQSQISEVLSVAGSLAKSEVSVIEEIIAEGVSSVKESTEKHDSLSEYLRPAIDHLKSILTSPDPVLVKNDTDLSKEGYFISDKKIEMNTTFEMLKDKAVESDGSKIHSEEISEHLVQSKTSSNETVINTVSESAKKHRSDLHNIQSEPNGSTISEKLSMETGSQVVSEQIDDLAVSPENVTGSLSPVLESISPTSYSPQKSVENGSEQVSEQISKSAIVSEGLKSSVQSESEQIISSDLQEVTSSGSEPKTKSSSSKTIQEELSDKSGNSRSALQAVASPPLKTSDSPEPTKLSTEKTISVVAASKSGVSTTKSARKRLDMDVGDMPSKETSERESKMALAGYSPTVKIEGGKRSISELIRSETTSEGSSVSEQIPTDQTGSVVEESATEKSSATSEALEQVEEEVASASDSALDKLDFSLGSLAGYKPSSVATVNKGSPSQTEAGDNINVSQELPAELPEDKKELGQGDEPGREIELGEIEADSLEADPFKGFDTSYDPEEFAKYFDSSFEKEPGLELSPIKPPSDATVMQMLQTSCKIADKIWENDLAEMKGKSSEETPLLSALQRESQQNFNVDSISQLIFDSFVEDATSAALTAYAKKSSSSPGKSPDSGNPIEGNTPPKVGDNEKLWPGDDFTLQAAHEAEQLRLKQLQIEQEIEQLQAQEVVPSYYYVREIPNKPPPPYTPPKPAPPSKEETVSRVLQGGEILWDMEMSGGDPSAAAIPANYLSNLQDDPYRMFLFDLTKELYLKVKPRPPEPTPPWVVSRRRGKPLPPVRCKEDLLKHMEKEAKLAFGFEPRILRESLIMKWTRKRRDHVDEILVRELQESEAEWRDFTVEENIIKSRVAESIMADALEEAADALALAFTNKFKHLTVQQS